jgi:plastocyanin
VSRAFARASTDPSCVRLAFLCVALAMPANFAIAIPTAPIVDSSIERFSFAPKEITIMPGTKVIWTNRDEAPHAVTSNDRLFASKGLDTDDKFEHTFANEGDFRYFCTVHPFMTGVVHVRR